ncbi:hypothetical protein DMH04_16125 [Kibdelosporangium aridum]|uniref:Uncharacterized protein n=1 Tax=Kibdelosporangium aridum TaxID=2030 RepID=A0A428ZCD3_KIBAR|nr:hypothetical protein [Kibdelosporangium aridum]RSM85729.1 hypothetical protein DMH04_16125 [Kibdelosporangium aridum]
MAEATTPSVEASRPDPANAATPADFVEGMRSLKRWVGCGYRQLEKRASAAGKALPRSTLTVALARDTLPREDLVVAFALACGCDEDQVAGWVAARRRIAAAGTIDIPAVAGVAPRRRARVVIALVTLAVAIATVVYAVTASSPSEPHSAPDQAAPPATPGLDQTGTPSPVPDSSTATPSVPMTTTTSADQNPVIPAAAAASSPPPQQSPAKLVPKATPPTQTALPTQTPPTQTTPPAPRGRETVELPGEAPIHCPTPYLVTAYGPVAQCTQRSGDNARIGYYSPITREFGPTSDWLSVVDPNWFDGSMQATDGVRADSRGHATIATSYGPGVWATQYRDGKARWGVINLMTNEFHPASQGWQPIAS